MFDNFAEDWPSWPALAFEGNFLLESWKNLLLLMSSPGKMRLLFGLIFRACVGAVAIGALTFLQRP